MNERRLSELWIYPVKSLGGIQLNSAKVMEKGLQYDRRWMLVDETGMFMTQRILPALALFKLKLESEKLSIQFGSESMELVSTTEGDLFEAKIWNDSVGVKEVNSKISSWFSDHLKLKCRLVSFPEKQNRLVEEKHRINNENVSLADAYPFLIIGQSSLDLLNAKLEKPLPMNRFRPNFVFTGGEPHEEDAWKNFAIGTNRFVGVKPCIRCTLTTIDQNTAQKGDEPLRTLATYRRQDNKISFGQNLLAVDHTEVRVGDIISIQKTA